MKLALIVAAASFTGLIALATGGCSSSTSSAPGSSSGTSGSSGANGTPDGTASSSSKFSCCINDVFYACPDQAAFDKCSGTTDPGACDAQCGADPMCHADCAQQASGAKHDTSACTKQTGACPSTDDTSSGSGTAICTTVGGEECSLDSQCGSGNHCAGGECYPNDSGSKCDLDSQCGSGNHCTDGCCQSNSTGTTCDLDSQCGSGNHCTNGSCYENAQGSPCSLDSQCGSSGNCTSGKCQ